MATVFTPQNRGVLIQRFAAGCSIPDACSGVVNESTFKKWLTKGHKEEGTDYAQFASDVKAAREQAKAKPEPMTEEEHRLEVSERARAGNIKALELYWKILQADKAAAGDEETEVDPMAEFDELAELRATRAA